MDSGPDRTQLPGFVVNWAARLFGRAFARRLAMSGASVGQWPIFLALSEEPGLTQAGIARTLDLEQPTVANTLMRMERDGFIARQAHPEDGRQVNLYLTDTAKRLLPRLRTAAAEINDQALAGFTPAERKAFFALMHRMVDNLRRADADNGAGAPARPR